MQENTAAAEAINPSAESTSNRGQPALTAPVELDLEELAQIAGGVTDTTDSPTGRW